MLKWVAYTLLFGLFANVDNVAHIAGFVSGAALGWLTPVARNRRGGSSPVLLAGTILSAVLVAWFLFKIFTPMELNEALVYLVGLSSQ
jgi:membrane associated rhomboid family serine protease